MIIVHSVKLVVLDAGLPLKDRRLIIAKEHERIKQLAAVAESGALKPMVQSCSVGGTSAISTHPDAHYRTQEGGACEPLSVRDPSPHEDAASTANNTSGHLSSSGPPCSPGLCNVGRSTVKEGQGKIQKPQTPTAK